ncbi:hypothetical protein [Vibrio vulnificus]|uniref:hypothetical protein n=1 Tax=Vibrio vulnificus TaxID=672 RepID=UPI00287AAE93|nr:hypothetical protein [Vibrio vulnificus]MDS1873085.1 hypothetical protein [Vibrio vulnificus]
MSRFIDKVKRNPKNSLVMAVAFVVAILFFTFTENYKAAFVGNIIPELVGVAIELVLIMVALDLIVKKQEKEKNKKLEQRAREYLRFIIVNLLKNKSIFKRAVKIEPRLKDFENNPRDYEFLSQERELNQAIIEAIQKSLDGLESESVISHIKTHIRLDLPAFHSLTPVIAQVSGKHLKKWGRILYFMTLIDEKDDTIKNMKVILGKIIEFDLETSRLYKI